MGEMVRLCDRGAVHDVHSSARRTFSDHRTVSDYRTVSRHRAVSDHRTVGDHRAFGDGSSGFFDPAPGDSGDEPAEHDPADDGASPTSHYDPTPAAHDDDHCPELRRRFLLRVGKDALPAVDEQGTASP
jgi:hypothetical protein